MVEIKKLGIVLEPTGLDFERLAVFNPGTMQDGEFVHLFYRAVDEENRSSVGYAKLKGPTSVVERWKKPIVAREHTYESMGIEDPRLVKFGDTYYMFYVAHDGKNAVTAYAVSKDLKTFQKMGVITPQLTYHETEEILRGAKLKDAYLAFASFYEEQAGKDVLLWAKDVTLFPRKIRGKLALLVRILPEMQIVFFDDFKELTDDFWKEYLKNLPRYVVLENKHWFETDRIGGGPPPIETEDGWLLIFHAVEARNQGRIYRACAALLDRDDPRKVIGRLHEPLFSPEEEWERVGLVPDVTFPTGTAVFGDTLYIYYGAADKRVAVASVSLKELISEMKDPTKRHGYGKKNKT